MSSSSSLTVDNIPVFDVQLYREALLESVERIRDSDDYDLNDIHQVSNWIGVCAYTFMAQQHAMRTHRPINPMSPQTKTFYQNRCNAVSSISYTILKKMGVSACWCYTQGPREDVNTHCSVVGFFYGQEKETKVLYDHSLRQYFDTNIKGAIKKTSRKNEMQAQVIDTLLGKDSLNMTNDLLRTGSTELFGRNLDVYLRALGGIEPDLLPVSSGVSIEELQQKKNFVSRNCAQTPDVLYKPWAALPHERNGEKIIQNYMCLMMGEKPIYRLG